MKYILIIASSLALTVGCSRSPVDEGAPSRPPRHFGVAIPPGVREADRSAVAENLFRFYVERTIPGDRVDVFDARNLMTITSATIPSASAYRNTNARTRHLAPSIAKVKEFLDKPQTAEGEPPAAIRLPQLAEWAATHVFDHTDALEDCLVVVGSPFFFHDTRETLWNLVEGTGDAKRGFWPSDAHISAPPKESPYGTKGREALLKGVSVHYALIAPEFVGEMQRIGLARFTRMWVASQSGSLDSYSSDVAITFERAALGRKADLADEKPDPKDHTPRMITASFMEDMPGRSAPQPLETFAGLARIGIRWKGGASETRLDLDLYVLEPGAVRELYYDQTTTRVPGSDREGFFYRDIRTGNGLDVEFVELHTRDIRNLAVFVNFYSGSSETPVEGEIRVDFHGRVFVGDFVIHEKNGNQGRDRATPRAGGHWVKIDMARLIGATPKNTAALR